MTGPRWKRKRRTREHVVADLSVNHVERIILHCGHTAERFWHDYGFDLLLYTYDKHGEYENGDVRLQVKATDRLKRSAGGHAISCRIEGAHLRHWLREPMPVILIVYDANQDEAYWLYVQRHFEEHNRLRIGAAAVTMTVRIPVKNVLNEEAIRQFAGFRNSILIQARGVIHRHE